MKELRATIYECEFCRKYYKMKHAAVRHEKYCSKNPANQHACWGCKFLDDTPEDVETEYGPSFSVKAFRCKKHDEEMHSYVAERRRMEVAERTSLMPIECDDFCFGWE